MKKKSKLLLLFIPLIIIIFVFIILLPKKGKKKDKPNDAVKEEILPIVIAKKVSKSNLPEYIITTGKLEGISHIKMMSEISGKLISLNKNLGDWVNKGESIGSVDNRVIKIRLEQSRASLLASDAKYSVAQQNMEAIKQLFDANEVSRTEYDESVATFTSAKANVENAKLAVKQAEIDLDNSLFKAPSSGYITDLKMNIGEYILMETYIGTIVNSKELVINAGVSEKDIGKIKKGNSVIVEYNNKSYSAKIIGFGIALSHNGFSYPVKIKLKNDGTLFPGSIAKIKILSQVFKDIIKISNNYISVEYGKSYIFVVSMKNILKRREIKTGKSVEDFLIVEDGVSVGEYYYQGDMGLYTDGTKVEVNRIEDE